jgi:hypothetical protein
MAKAVFNQTKTLFISKLDLNIKKKLVNCTALYDDERGTLRKVGQKYL